MKLDVNKIEAAWNKWSKINAVDAYKVEEVRVTYLSNSSKSYKILEAPKAGVPDVYDFIGQCTSWLELEKDDLVDRDDDRYKYQLLTKEEFLPIAEKVIKDDWKLFVDIDNATNIWVMFEWWDLSYFIIEYKDKWQYFSLELIY